jgi:hypothetical protein
MSPYSISSWDDLEHKFPKHFFSKDYALDLVGLASLWQGVNESVMIVYEGLEILETDVFRSMSQISS